MDKGWYALVAFTIGWLIAQVSKVIILAFRRDEQEKMNFGQLVGYFTQSGGMPSGHTASLTAAAVCLGCAYGFSSGVFALAACIWSIVIYDAIHVRYAVGVQGEALNKLLQQAKQPELPIVRGHTVPQVAVGAVIGVVVGLVVWWIFEGF